MVTVANQQMLTWKRSWLLASGALTIAVVLSWVAAALWSRPAPLSTSEGRPPAAKKAARALAPVTTLHQQATSAYHVRLFADDEGVVLITPTGFTTLRPGRGPEEHVVALGSVAVRQGGAVVFWRSGKLRSVSLSGDDEHELAEIPRTPQYLLASESHLAWIQTERQAGTTLQVLSGGEARLIVASEKSVTASVLRGSVVYWVSEARDGSWAIERVSLDGRPPRSTSARRGRPPAMLAVGRDGVYFYDGPQRGVRRLGFELEQETAVSSPVICSPLAASSRVVCAHVGGLFDISPSARSPRPLAAEGSGPITALAATDERAYWVAESEGERLVVRSIGLPEP